MTEDPNLARLLGANPFFGRMQPDVLQAIAGLCVTRKLSTNEVLFQKLGGTWYAFSSRKEIQAMRSSRSGGARSGLVPALMRDGDLRSICSGPEMCSVKSHFWMGS